MNQELQNAIKSLVKAWDNEPYLNAWAKSITTAMFQAFEHHNASLNQEQVLIIHKGAAAFIGNVVLASEIEQGWVYDIQSGEENNGK